MEPCGLNGGDTRVSDAAECNTTSSSKPVLLGVQINLGIASEKASFSTSTVARSRKQKGSSLVDWHSLVVVKIRDEAGGLKDGEVGVA
jgi:hypothetical protein